MGVGFSGVAVGIVSAMLWADAMIGERRVYNNGSANRASFRVKMACALGRGRMVLLVDSFFFISQWVKGMPGLC